MSGQFRVVQIITKFYWRTGKEACQLPPLPSLTDIHKLLRTSQSNLLIVSMAAELYMTAANWKRKTVIFSWSPRAAEFSALVTQDRTVFSQWFFPPHQQLF